MREARWGGCPTWHTSVWKAEYVGQDKFVALTLLLCLFSLGLSHVLTRSFVTYAPFRRFWGDVHRKFMQHRYVLLHITAFFFFFLCLRCSGGQG
jgi:hypothetical protein